MLPAGPLHVLPSLEGTLLHSYSIADLEQLINTNPAYTNHELIPGIIEVLETFKEYHQQEGSFRSSTDLGLLSQQLNQRVQQKLGRISGKRIGEWKAW